MFNMLMSFYTNSRTLNVIIYLIFYLVFFAAIL